MQLHRLVVALLLLADCIGFSRALSHASHQPGVELQIGWPRPRLDLNPGADDATLARSVVESSNLVRGEDSGLPDQVVSAWNEQVLELDELTRCIRASESGNAIERWLDCLASLEEAPEPAVALPPSLATPQSPVSPDIFINDGEVNALHLPADHTKMVTFDPLSVSSTGSRTSGTLDENSDVVQSSMKDTGYGMAQHHISDQSQNFEPAASLEDEGSEAEAEAGASSGGGGDRESVAQIRRPGDSTVLEMTEHQMPLEDNRLFEGTTGGAQKVRRSSSKWGTDISSVSADSRSLENR